MQEAMPPFAARHRSNIFWIITETNLPSSVRSPTPRATRTDSSFPQSKAALETVRSVLGLPAPPLISPRSKLAFQATRKRRNSWKRKRFRRIHKWQKAMRGSGKKRKFEANAASSFSSAFDMRPVQVQKTIGKNKDLPLRNWTNCKQGVKKLRKRGHCWLMVKLSTFVAFSLVTNNYFRLFFSDSLKLFMLSFVLFLTIATVSQNHPQCCHEKWSQLLGVRVSLSTTHASLWRNNQSDVFNPALNSPQQGSSRVASPCVSTLSPVGPRWPGDAVNPGWPLPLVPTRPDVRTSPNLKTWWLPTSSLCSAAVPAPISLCPRNQSMWIHRRVPITILWTWPQTRQIKRFASDRGWRNKFFPIKRHYLPPKATQRFRAQRACLFLDQLLNTRS